MKKDQLRAQIQPMGNLTACAIATKRLGLKADQRLGASASTFQAQVSIMTMQSQPPAIAQDTPLSYFNILGKAKE